MAGTRLVVQLCFMLASVLLAIYLLLDVPFVISLLNCVSLQGKYKDPGAFTETPSDIDKTSFFQDVSVTLDSSNSVVLMEQRAIEFLLRRNSAVVSLVVSASLHPPRLVLDRSRLLGICDGLSQDDCLIAARDTQAQMTSLLRSKWNGQFPTRLALRIMTVNFFNQSAPDHFNQIWDLVVKDLLAGFSSLYPVAKLSIIRDTAEWPLALGPNASAADAAQALLDEARKAALCADCLDLHLWSFTKISHATSDFTHDATRDVASAIYLDDKDPRSAVLSITVDAELNPAPRLRDSLIRIISSIIRRNLGLDEDMALANNNVEWSKSALRLASPPADGDIAVVEMPAGTTCSPHLISPWESRWIRVSLEAELAEGEVSMTRELKDYCDRIQQWPLFMHDLRIPILHYLRSIDALNNLKDATLSEAVRNVHLIARDSSFELLSLFPIEYVIAVLAPFWFPIIIPVFHGVISEIKRYRSHKNKSN
jgi:hypothetical protein